LLPERDAERRAARPGPGGPDPRLAGRFRHRARDGGVHRHLGADGPGDAAAPVRDEPDPRRAVQGRPPRRRRPGPRVLRDHPALGARGDHRRPGADHLAALKTFDLVYMTTSGGPGNSTTVPSYEVYFRAFDLREVGSASAV